VAAFCSTEGLPPSFSEFVRRIGRSAASPGGPGRCFAVRWRCSRCTGATWRAAVTWSPPTPGRSWKRPM